MEVKEKELVCIRLPPSIYAKAEHVLQEWQKFGNDYDNDPVFRKAEALRDSPY